MNHPKETRRNKVLAVLGSIMAVGAFMPPPTATEALASAGALTIQRATPSQPKPVANATTNTAPGQALRALLATGDTVVNGGGCPPKIWGMSSYCHKMRRQNFRAGKTASFKAKRRA